MRWLSVLLLLVGCAGPVVPNVTPVTPPPPPPPYVGPVSVLIIEDEEARFLLPQWQRDQMASPEVRGYVATHGAKTTDGVTPDFRILGVGQNVENEHAFWREGMARPRTKTPWVIITNGQRGTEGPLPQNLLDEVKKYGGP